MKKVPTSTGLVQVRGRKVFQRFWKGSRKPKGVVLYLHGVGSFAGNKTFTSEGIEVGDFVTAMRFAAEGYHFYNFDFVGHGKSEGPRRVDSIDEILQDTLKTISQITGKHPKLPLFLLGQSMGAAIAIRVANQSPENLRGILLISPPFRSSENLPNSAQSLFLKTMATIGKNAKIPSFIWSNEIEGVKTDDPKIVRFYEDMIKAKMHWKLNYKSALTMTKMCAQIPNEVKKLQVPFAIAVGKKDPTLQTRLVRNHMIRSKTSRCKQKITEFDCHGYPLMDAKYTEVVDYFIQEMRKM